MELGPRLVLGDDSGGLIAKITQYIGDYLNVVPTTESPRIRGRTELMEAKLDMVAQLHCDKSVVQDYFRTDRYERRFFD